MLEEGVAMRRVGFASCLFGQREDVYGDLRLYSQLSAFSSRFSGDTIIPG